MTNPTAVVVGRWGDEGELSTHRGFVSNERRVADTKSLRIGDIIAFMYDAKPRFAFVVHPNWINKLHALDLKHIDRTTLVNSIMPRLDVANDPKIFYDTVYKPTKLYSLDAYRTYNIPKIQQIIQFDYNVPDNIDQKTRERYDTNYRGNT